MHLEADVTPDGTLGQWRVVIDDDGHALPRRVAVYLDRFEVSVWGHPEDGAWLAVVAE